MQILKASAGSGKTYALAYAYVRNVIETPESYASILAVTFTNKATDEMKRRILKELDALRSNQKHPYVASLLKDTSAADPQEITRRAERALTLILHDYSRFSVMTIDRFFQRILREFVRELGIESDYTVDFNIDYLVEMAVDRLIDRSDSDVAIAQNIRAFADEKMEKGGNYDIKRELAAFAKNLFSENFDNDNISTVKERYKVFYEAAAATVTQVKAEIAALATTAVAVMNAASLSEDDFPRKSKGLAAYLRKCAAGDVSDYNSYVAEAKNDSVKKWGASESVKGEILPILCRVCDTWDYYRRFITSVDICSKSYRKFLLLSDMGEELHELCLSRNVMLLSATTRLLSGLIEENDAPFIYEKCGNRFSVFMIDEFQDTSVKQWRNFAPLINNALSQCEKGVCTTIVGDVKQSIYRWRGGDWKLLHGGIRKDILLQEQVSEVTLDTNWRSRRNVVAFNNALMKSVVRLSNEMINDKLVEGHVSGAITLLQRDSLYDTVQSVYRKLEQRYSPQNSEEKGYVLVEECDFKAEENLARMIEIIKGVEGRGCRAKDIAVVVRTNREAKMVVEALLEQKNNPENSEFRFDAISNQSLYLNASEAIRFVLCCFRYALQPDRGNLLVSAEYNVRCGRAINTPLEEQEREMLLSLREYSITEAFERVLEYHNVAATPNDVAYLQAFYEHILNFSAQNISDIPLFLEWWEKEKGHLSITLPDGEDAINVITIHSCKGLEYQTVVVPFLNWDLEPRGNASLWSEQSAEPFDVIDSVILSLGKNLADSHFGYAYFQERVMSYVDNVNVLYVALTRASSELYLLLPIEGGKTTVSDLVKISVEEREEEAIVNSGGEAAEIKGADVRITGRVTKKVDSEGFFKKRYTFGTPEQFGLHVQEQEEREVVASYCSCDYHYNDRVKLRYSSDRYYEDETGEKQLSPRSYGILMHRIFERIESEQEIENVMTKMCYDGELTTSERDELLILIRKAFENKQIKQFFEFGWSVKNEQNILMPAERDDDKLYFRRPDRVIVSGTKAKVLDYKFGSVVNDRNKSQMREYIHILHQMGYEEVEGYVWYVRLGEIVKIDKYN